PAEQTPFSALALGVLAQEAGVPDGLLNIITGDAAAIGKALTESETVRKISFTGSTAVGIKLFEQSAPTIKKLSLELGGNAPFIVFDDADIDDAVEGAMVAKFRNAGQTCVCTNRIYAQAAIYDEFVEKLGKAMAKLLVGAGTEPDTAIGPLIDEAALAKVEAHVADAKAKGGTVLTGGQRHDAGARFYQPTLITDATQDMMVATEETFGPVAPVFRFETEEEAIAMANDTEFGLASYFYARDLGRVWRVAEALETGMVGINSGAISTEVAPFGGIKSSGLGREGSSHGLEDYEELKYLHMAL
ncbi:aldehyde dehydrogenase family protein, partial [Erythrobacter sp.]|uniref:aldehyde dehydrogenase family protein n=1 Tax=Erythrobacter sp. TaxID=1042 RepID=UPI00311ED2D4